MWHKSPTEERWLSDGTTAVIVADLRDPDAVLGNAQVRALIDFGVPVGLLMTAVLQFVADEDDPWGLVGRYLAALCPGSYLALSDITRDKLPPRLVQTGVQIYQRASESAFPRTLPEIERFFTGLEVVPPYEGAGPVLANVGQWGSEDPASADTDGSRAFYCGVAGRP
jgi:S-adenosyl methyltransferase